MQSSQTSSWSLSDWQNILWKLDFDLKYDIDFVVKYNLWMFYFQNLDSCDELKPIVIPSGNFPFQLLFLWFFLCKSGKVGDWDSTWGRCQGDVGDKVTMRFVKDSFTFDAIHYQRLIHLQVSQTRWPPSPHWKILVGGGICSKQTCINNKFWSTRSL